LDHNQAKTIVHYAIMTYGLPNLRKVPILSVYGPAGTGKTTLLQILGELSHAVVHIDGKVTGPMLRDRLRPDTTALIDEADGVHEEWLVNRYSRDSAQTDVNRQRESRAGFRQQKLDLFGATALHRRVPFKDPAILSRSIAVNTRHVAGGVEPFRAAAFKPYAAVARGAGREGGLGTGH